MRAARAEETCVRVYVASEGYQAEEIATTVRHRPLGMLHAVDPAQPGKSLCGMRAPHQWPDWPWSGEGVGPRCPMCDIELSRRS